MVEGPIEKVIRKEIIVAIREVELGMAGEPSEVCAEMIRANIEVGIINVIIKFCRRVLNGKGMPDKWQTRACVPIFKGNAGARNFNAYWR